LEWFFVQTATLAFKFNLLQTFVICIQIRQSLQQLCVEDLGPNIAQSRDTVVVALGEVEGVTAVEDERIWDFILVKVL